MLRPLLPNKSRLLHLDPRPPLQPIRHPLDIRLLINSNAPQPLTRLASLVVHHGVVPVSGAIPPNANGDLLAAPASLFAGGVGAEEGGHYVCFVFVGVVGGVGSGDVFEIGGWGDGSVEGCEDVVVEVGEDDFGFLVVVVLGVGLGLILCGGHDVFLVWYSTDLCE